MPPPERAIHDRGCVRRWSRLDLTGAHALRPIGDRAHRPSPRTGIKLWRHGTVERELEQRLRAGARRPGTSRSWHAPPRRSEIGPPDQRERQGSRWARRGCRDGPPRDTLTFETSLPRMAITQASSAIHELFATSPTSARGSEVRSAQMLELEPAPAIFVTADPRTVEPPRSEIVLRSRRLADPGFVALSERRDV